MGEASFTILSRVIRPAWGLLVALVLVMPAAAGESRGGYETIDAARLQALIEHGVTVVDVRTPEEWRQTGVIPGSERIMAFTPDGRINPDFAADLQAAVADGEAVALICRTGRRSGIVSQALSRDDRYPAVYNVGGGMRHWLAEGRPVEACERC